MQLEDAEEDTAMTQQLITNTMAVEPYLIWTEAQKMFDSLQFKIWRQDGTSAAWEKVLHARNYCTIRAKECI